MAGALIKSIVFGALSKLAETSEAAPRLGMFGQQITDGAFGKYYELTKKGYLYVYSTALAGNALIVAGTANAPVIWNQTTSGKDLVILRVLVNRTAVGTPLEGGITYLREAYSLGANIGTGAPVVSGTHVAPINCLGPVGTPASAMRFFPTTTVFTSGAMLFFANAGLSQTADNGATTVSGPRTFMLRDDVDGAIIVPPGGAFALGAQVSVSTTYSVSIIAAEVPA